MSEEAIPFQTVRKVVNLVFPSHEVSIYSASEFCDCDVIYFVHTLDIYRTSPMRVRILARKCEEATGFSASLLATSLVVMVHVTSADISLIARLSHRPVFDCL